MLANLLKRKNIASVIKTDGSQAVEYLKGDIEACNVVFMDNLMPVMNGIDATRAIRGLGYRHLIIGCTGNVMEDDVRCYLDAGADMVLYKPLRMNQLELLLKHLNAKGSLSIEGMKLKEVNGALEFVSI